MTESNKSFRKMPSSLIKHVNIPLRTWSLQLIHSKGNSEGCLFCGQPFKTRANYFLLVSFNHFAPHQIIFFDSYTPSLHPFYASFLLYLIVFLTTLLRSPSHYFIKGFICFFSFILFLRLLPSSAHSSTFLLSFLIILAVLPSPIICFIVL